MTQSIDYQLHVAPFPAALIAQVSLVYAACFGEPPPPDFGSRVEERPGVLLQLALLGTEPVGYKLGYRRSPEAFYSWLGGVVPQHRRRGIAQELLQRQHAWCRAQGYRRVRTDTTNRFRDMLLLNLRAGFDVIGTYQDAARELTIMLERGLSQGADRHPADHLG